jgi:hypothetical protein
MTPSDPPPIDSRAAFREAVIDFASHDAAVEWWWCDPDFADWPLDDPRLIEALKRWLSRPGRQLTLLACGFDRLRAQHPRFVVWRRLQAHRVFGRAVAAEASRLPTLLLGEAPRAIHVVDRERWRGLHVGAAGDWRDLREGIDALVQQSEPSFAAELLGL